MSGRKRKALKMNDSELEIEMEKDLIAQWELRKNQLEDYFRNTPQEEYFSYGEIFAKLIELVFPDYDHEKITEIDDGEYQGTKLFFVPKKIYQPEVEDYLWTWFGYGSCSECDTLQSIEAEGNPEHEKPNEQQLKDYMTIALHLVESLKRLEPKQDNCDLKWLPAKIRYSDIEGMKF